MWANDRQRCHAIIALLSRVHLDRLWTDTGPTGEACRLLDAGGGPLSHGEALMLRVAFDMWNGEGKVTIDEILSVVDGPNLRAIGSFLVTFSASHPDIDGWIVKLEDVA